MQTTEAAAVAAAVGYTDGVDDDDADESCSAVYRLCCRCYRLLLSNFRCHWSTAIMTGRSIIRLALVSAIPYGIRLPAEWAKIMRHTSAVFMRMSKLDYEQCNCRN